MSAYKVELYVGTKYVGCSWKDTYDLIDDFDMEEEEAKEIFDKLKAGRDLGRDVYEMFEEKAKRMVGYESDATAIEGGE